MELRTREGLIGAAVVSAGAILFSAWLGMQSEKSCREPFLNEQIKITNPHPGMDVVEVDTKQFGVVLISFIDGRTVSEVLHAGRTFAFMDGLIINAELVSVCPDGVSAEDQASRELPFVEKLDKVIPWNLP